ncbi:MAG: hypothetical protein ACREL7_19610 [Longimicrobiales bacterium]
MKPSAMRCGIEFVAAAFTVLSLAGCGEAPAVEEDMAPAGAEDSAGGANPHIDAADLCALVPLADVAQAAGGTEPLRSETGERAPASCRYFYDVADPYGARQASATVQMLDGYSLERMGAGNAAIDVAGVGDEAWARSHTDTYLLYTRRGPLTFSVNVAGGNSDNWPQMARAVAEVVLEHL